ncbi:MAG: CPBP family intramembrane metalloprotease [Kiritimatiellae bacterium]|nr:CPBP family intramembrane metalloprotease [Kiritimatiellia bacterium]
MNRLKFTLKAWPVVAAATIGLCFLTKSAAEWFGMQLPDQPQVEIVRKWILHAFDSAQSFWTCAILLLQVLVLLPAVEEIVFRWLLFILPTRLIGRISDGGKRSASHLLHVAGAALPVLSSALFSAAHYIAQPFPDAAFVALFFFGLAQCWLYRKTDRIWCPMLNHFLFNLTNLVLMFVLPE